MKNGTALAMKKDEMDTKKVSIAHRNLCCLCNENALMRWNLILSMDEQSACELMAKDTATWIHNKKPAILLPFPGDIASNRNDGGSKEETIQLFVKMRRGNDV